MTITLGQILLATKRWSNEGMLPWFRKTESHHDPKGLDPRKHGFGGPIYTTASARTYPLKELLRTSFLKGTGLPENPDANGGNPIGIAPYTENWKRSSFPPEAFAHLRC